MRGTRSLGPLTIGLALLLLAIGGCHNPGQSSLRRRASPPPPRVDRRLLAAHTRFALKLFSELRREQPAANVFISPTSIALALSMTLNGAAGDTQRAMAQALDLQGLGLGKVNKASATLIAGLQNADPEVKLAIANSLWGDKATALAPAFVKANEASYGAMLSVLDLRQPGAADTINQWVSEHTEGLIPSIVTPADLAEAIVLVLANAAYFRGPWSNPFNRTATRDWPFTRLDGSQKTLPLMTQSGGYAYLEQPGFQAIRLPYGYKRLAMYVFLPAQGRSLQEFCDTLTPVQWESWLPQFAEKRGSISLPRLKVEFAATLNRALTALGMGIAFDARRADFSPMVSPSQRLLWIAFVKHRACLEVDEKGTKAAAATAVGMEKGLPAPAAKPFEMVVDRPFFCAIVDSATGEVLFMGNIVDPA
jgi:serine protease inhibitor